MELFMECYTGIDKISGYAIDVVTIKMLESYNQHSLGSAERVNVQRFFWLSSPGTSRSEVSREVVSLLEYLLLHLIAAFIHG